MPFIRLLLAGQAKIIEVSDTARQFGQTKYG
jgi:hypothetical protein